MRPVPRNEAHALIRRVSAESRVPRGQVRAAVQLGGTVTPAGFLAHDGAGFTLRPTCTCVVGYVPELNCRQCRGVGA